MTKQDKKKKDFSNFEIEKGREKNYFNLNAIYKTVLQKNNKTAMVTFKDMTLTVMEMNNGKKMKTVFEKTFQLGDIGKMQYTKYIREYVKSGFENISSESNIDDMLKEFKKQGKTKNKSEESVDELRESDE